MKYFYSLLLIAISFQLHAQRNFKPGYIVTLRGDTTQGLVNLREWNENPRNIIFKTAEQSTPSQYTPANIKAFGANQVDHYRSYIGPVTKGTVALAELSSGIDSTFVVDTIFLRTLTGGKNLTLFIYKDRIKTRYFIAEKNHAAVELKRYVYLDNNQANKIREYNLYIQQLLEMATKFQPDDKQIAGRIITSTYDLSHLQDIVFRLNGQTNNYASNTATRDGHRFFIGASANLTTASSFGEMNNVSRTNIFTSSTTAQSVAPSITGGIDYYFNRSAPKLLFRVEANLLLNKINLKYNNSYWDGARQVEQDENLTFNQMAVGINPQLVYNLYIKDKFQFYLAGGLQLNFSSFTNQHYFITNYFDGKLESNTDKPLLYRKMAAVLTAKTGIVLADCFDIYAGYYAPTAITDYPAYGVNIYSLHFGINYLFGGKNNK